MVPLVLPALLVFSRLAPDAGRSAAFGLLASLPLPHSPAALCLRPIIPLPDLCSVLQGALVASIVEEIFLLLQIAPQLEKRSGKIHPETALWRQRDETHPHAERTDRHRRAEAVVKIGLAGGRVESFCERG